MSEIRNLLSETIAQVNALLQDFERRALVEQQKTRDKVGELRDGLRDDMDARFDVAFGEIDEIKNARSDLAAAVKLVQAVQQDLMRLAAYLDRATPTKVARRSTAALILTAVNLLILALHHWYIVERLSITLIRLAGGD